MPPKTNEQLYEEAERQLIGEAIGETEQEIFDSAFDNAPDDNDGDNSLEEMDTEDVVDDDLNEDEEDDLPEEGEGEFDDEPEPEQPKDAQPQERQQQRGIPPARLREEAEARRAAEAETKELRARLDALERNQRQPPQEQPKPPPAPDMFADPDGWAAAERAKILQEINNQRFNTSMADAHEQHGEKFEAAFNALRGLNPQNPADAATGQSIYNAPNPGKALMRWHEQQNLVREIGNDPAAYRQRLRDELLADPEVRQQLISGMRQDATGNQRTNVRLPPSLNGASGGTSHRGRDGGGRDTAYTTRSMEREIFDSVWDDK